MGQFSFRLAPSIAGLVALWETEIVELIGLRRGDYFAQP